MNKGCEIGNDALIFVRPNAIVQLHVQHRRELLPAAVIMDSPKNNVMNCINREVTVA